MTAIHWLSDIDGDFSTAADWSGGVVPGPSDNAFLRARGSDFTVTASVSETVKSIKLAANATLDITGGTFTARTGTGGGANAGTIEVGEGASFAVGGPLDNTGGITLQGAKGSDASLSLTSNTALSGGGTVTLGGTGAGGYQVIEAAAVAGTVTLTNVDNTICGTGGIIGYHEGAQSLILVNQSNGIIGGGTNNAQDFLDIGSYGGPSGLATIINAGLIESSNGASVRIFDADISGIGGRISAEDNSTEYSTYVSLQGCSIIDQTLATSFDGFLLFENCSVITGDNIQNAGGISVLNSNLTLNDNVTLSGGGVVRIATLTKGAPPSVVSGSDPSVVLTNVDNMITMDGDLGDGKLTLVNENAGTIQANGGKLTIDTGANTILNAGLIEIYAGSGAINSAIDNVGVIAAYGNALTIHGAVTGTGDATIGGGTLDFASSFNQDVTFTGTTGVLVLAQSLAYTASVTGFSTTGGTSLDLKDIGFVSANEATFSGTSSSGVLTVTDGTHTARIALLGDYVEATFTATSDGRGGTVITAGGGGAKPPHALIAAMASFGASRAHVNDVTKAWSAREPLLAGPRETLA